MATMFTRMGSLHRLLCQKAVSQGQAMYKNYSKSIFECMFKSGRIFEPSYQRFYSEKVRVNGKSDEKPHCNIGTIGHIDHGKTTLSAAITKVMAEEGMAKFVDYEEIDRAPEEKARGITINACHLEYSTPKRHYAHTDCPGHIDYIKNMITGTSQMDCTILVVSALDGIMPQTQEHIQLAKQIGVKDVVVYINKADLADDDLLELVEIEVRDLLNEVGFDGVNCYVVSGSALCALNGTNPEIGKDSIMKLMTIIDENVPDPVRDMSGPPYMPIESAVTVPGRGTVIIGTLQQGILKKSSPIDVLGHGNMLKSTASDIQVFHKPVSEANAGDNVGVLLKGVKKEQIERGMYMCQPGYLSQHDTVEAQLYIRMAAEGGRKKPITPKYINQLFCDTYDIACCVLLPDGMNMAMPGDTCVSTVLLRKPMVIREGIRFMVRENQFTSITGLVTKLLPSAGIEIPGFNYSHAKNVKIQGNQSTVRSRRKSKK